MDPAIQTPIGEAGQAPPPPVPHHKWKKIILFGIPAAIILLYFLYVSYSIYCSMFCWELVDESGFSPTLQTSATQTPDLKINWKTYTNNEYGFEIKYPPNWYAKKDENLSNINQTYVIILNQGIEPSEFPSWTHPIPYFNITISKHQFLAQELQKTELDQKDPFNTGKPIVYSKSSPITFNGISANKTVGLYPGTTESISFTTIIFNTNTYGWTIKIPNKDEKGNYDPIFDQILSTFKFTP